MSASTAPTSGRRIIDRLAETGVRLEQFYAQPMCTPTRAALLTGRYPMRYGLQTLVILPDQTYGLPTTERLLPQALKDNGYSTAIVGKWHLGHAKREYWPRQRGFDYHYGPLIGEIDYFTHEMHGQRDWYRNNQPLKEKGYVTTLLGQDAVRLIGKHDTQKPLFMYLAFTAPHTPYQAPQDYLDKYKSVADPQRRAYSAMITAMDDQIGNVVQALEKRGMRDNTIIVFHSDNGGTRSALFAGQIETKGALPADNGPFRDGKGSLYEGGTRVAALVNWPARIKPGIVDQPMHVVDWFPTLTTLAGARPDGGLPLDGLDMWPTTDRGQTVAAPGGDLQYRNVPRRSAPGRLEAVLAHDPSVQDRVVQYRQRPVGEGQSGRTKSGARCRSAKAHPWIVERDGKVAIPLGNVQGLSSPNRRRRWRCRTRMRSTIPTRHSAC